MEDKKVIYIAGPITGVPNYWAIFEKMEEVLKSMGYIPLSPASLPAGMTNERYMRIDFALLDSADVVVFLPEWEESEGASLEYTYCKYTKKPYLFMLSPFDEACTSDYLNGCKHFIEEVLRV